jgi:hypothetical protein
MTVSKVKLKIWVFYLSVLRIFGQACSVFGFQPMLSKISIWQLYIFLSLTVDFHGLQTADVNRRLWVIFYRGASTRRDFFSANRDFLWFSETFCDFPRLFEIFVIFWDFREFLCFFVISRIFLWFSWFFVIFSRF